VASVVCNVLCFVLGACRDVMDAEGRATRGGAGAGVADARGLLPACGQGAHHASLRHKVSSPGGGGSGTSPALNAGSPSISDILKFGAVQYLYQRASPESYQRASPESYQRASPESEGPAASGDGAGRGGGVGQGRGLLMLREQHRTPPLADASASASVAVAPPGELNIALEESADASAASSAQGVQQAIPLVAEKVENGIAVGDAGSAGLEEACRDDEAATSAAPGPDKTKAERVKETGAATGGWKSRRRQEEERKTMDAAEERLCLLRRVERDRQYAEECAMLEAQWTARSTGSMSASWRAGRLPSTSPGALGSPRAPVTPPVQQGPLVRSQSMRKMPANPLELTPPSRSGSVHSLHRASSVPVGRLSFALLHLLPLLPSPAPQRLR